MIPILYPENETEFASNGIGRLTDAISCIVTQEVNGVYELSMRYPNDGIHADEITSNRIIYAQPEANKPSQPFRIRETDRTLKDQIKVVARHIAYDLSFYACAEFGQTKEVPYNVTPVLYSSSREAIGALSDATRWGISIEGNTFVLTMSYPSNGAYASRINTSCFIYAQPAIDKATALFDITEVRTQNRTIFIRGTAAITPDIPEEFNMMTVGQAVARIVSAANEIQAFPFVFAVAPISSGDAWSTQQNSFWSEKPESVRTLMGTDQGALIDVFGGEWEYDGFVCTLYESRGEDKGVEYRYGKNIRDISERINIDELYTHAFSFWKGTASSSTNSELGEYYVKRGNLIQALSSDYATMFPTQRVMILDASSDFEQEPTAAQLDAYTRKRIETDSIGKPTVTIDVQVADASTSEDYEDITRLESVNLCDTVTVVFPRFGVNIKAKVSKIEYDVLIAKNRAVTIGQTDVALADIIAQNRRNIIRTKYDLQKWADKMAERATEALAGWYGGNIRRNYSAADHKQQSMYIMDTDNVNTAENAIKLDRWGISISGNGANGDYQSFIDMKEKTFSDIFAEDGDTNGSFLKRGKIQPVVNAEDGKLSYIDLETAEADLYGKFRGHFDGEDIKTETDVTVGRNLFLNGKNLSSEVLGSRPTTISPDLGSTIWDAIKKLDERTR